MALKIFWTEEAISSFNKVIDYLIENWTEREVVKFTDALTKKLTLLTSGKVTFKSSVKKNYHEILITKHNLFIYRVKPEHVELILFWDTRQNPHKKKI
jgi:plasmid stabilization system protein ParE